MWSKDDKDDCLHFKSENQVQSFKVVFYKLYHKLILKQILFNLYTYSITNFVKILITKLQVGNIKFHLEFDRIEQKQSKAETIIKM